MTQPELSWIGDLVRDRRDALEIGTYCGRTTEILLQCMVGQIFSVDPMERAPPTHPEAREHIQSLADEFPERLIFIPAFSSELVWTRPVDVIFLDGSHQYEHVLADLRALLPSLRPGGRLIVDDVTCPDVDRAVTDFKLGDLLTPLDPFGKLAAWHNDRTSPTIPSS